MHLTTNDNWQPPEPRMDWMRRMVWDVLLIASVIILFLLLTGYFPAYGTEPGMKYELTEKLVVSADRQSVKLLFDLVRLEDLEGIKVLERDKRVLWLPKGSKVIVSPATYKVDTNPKSTEVYVDVGGKKHGPVYIWSAIFDPRLNQMKKVQ